MAKILTVNSGGLPFIPEGIYTATFVGYEEKRGLAYGDALKMNFEITEGDHKGTVLNQLVSERLSPQSNLGKIVRCLQGKPLKMSQEIDLDKLVGSACKIVVRTIAGEGTYADFSSVIEVKAITDGDLF